MPHYNDDGWEEMSLTGEIMPLDEDVPGGMAQRTYEPTEAPLNGMTERQDFAPLGALGALGRTAARIPENLVAKTIMAIQGQSGASVADRGIADRFVNWVDDRNRKLSEEYAEAGDLIPGVISNRDVADLGPNLAFSGTSMAGTVGGGLAGGLLGPPGAVAGGVAGGGATAYRMDSYQIMNDWLEKINQESIDNGLGPISKGEEEKFKDEMSSLATKHALWEAGPEGLGNVLELALLTAKNIPGVRWLPKGTLGKAAKGMMRLGGTLLTEETTETATQMGQHNVEVEAGTSDEPKREWTSGDDILKSAKEVLPQVLMLSGVMTAGGAAYRKAKGDPTVEVDILGTGMKTRETKQQEKFTTDLLAGMESGEITPERMQELRDSMPEGPLTDILDGFLTQMPEMPLAEEGIAAEPIVPPEVLPPEEMVVPPQESAELPSEQIPEEGWEEMPVEPTVEPTAPSEKTDVALEGEAVDIEAHEAATSPLNDLPEPTQAQKEAGNYKKGAIKIQGMDIAIENPEGSERKGVSPEGKEWSTLMKDHYGYFKRTEGKDGDQIDAFINAGQRKKSDNAYIIDQINPETGTFDEHKTMIGYADIDAAEQAYLANYEEGWQGLGNISEVPINEFKTWLKKGKQTKSYAPIEAAEAIEPETLPVTPETEEIAGIPPQAEPEGIKTRPPDTEGRRKADRRKWETREDFEKILAETQDVEEARELARQVSEKSYTDSLMGIQNKAAWLEHEAKEEKLPVEQRQYKSILDIDNFSWVNDVLGHEIGDNVLKQVGGILSEESDSSFRFGGEEFLIEGKDLNALDLQSKKIRGRIEAEITLEHVLGQDVTLEDGTKYKAGEKLTVKGMGLSYGISKDFNEADDILKKYKGKRTEAGIRSPKGREIQRLHRELPGGTVKEGKDDSKVGEKVAKPKREVSEKEYRDPHILVGKRINKKYDDILKTEESDLTGQVYEDIVERELTPEALEKHLLETPSENLSEEKTRIKSAIADNIGELIETHKYEGYEEGKAIEDYIDSLLEVVSRKPLPDKRTTTRPEILKKEKLPDDRRVKKPEQYVTKTTFKDSNISTKDVKSIFKGQKVGKSPDGTIFVRTALGRGVQIKSVETITPDETAFEVGYSRMKASGELIAGKYQDGVITISKVGDRYTLFHESEHFLEDANFINKNDQKALRYEIKSRAKKGTWKTLNPDDIGGKEDRAEFIAQELKKRTESRSTVQRVLQKIQDLVDGFVNLYKRTARGVVREVEAGKIYEKKGKVSEEKTPSFMVAGEKAIGAPTGALAKAQEMLAEGKDKQEVWRETGWLKGADGEFKFEIDDSGAKLLLSETSFLRMRGKSPDFVEAQPPTVKGFGKGVISGSDLLSNIIRSKAFLDKGYSGLDVETQRLVKSLMLRSAKESKVLNSVIKFIPVNMVSDLRRLELTPKMLLQNPSMLKLAITQDLIEGVPIAGTSSSLMKAFALSGAIKDTSDISFDTAGVPEDFRITDKTIYDRHKKYITRSGDTSQVRNMPLSLLLSHPELYEVYPQIKDVLISVNIKKGNPNTGTYSPAADSVEMSVSDINAIEPIILHEVQHKIQKIEGFARGGTPETAPTVDMDKVGKIRTKKHELYIDPYRIMNKISGGYVVTDYEEKALKEWKDLTEQEDELLSKQLQPYEAYKRLGGEIEARDTAARAKLTPAQRGLNFNKAKDLWEQSQTIRQSDKFQLEEQEWLASDKKEADLKKRNETSAHKKVYATEDKIIDLGYDLNQKLIREALAGGEVAQELLIQPLYEAQGIPEADWIIKKGSGTSFSVKEGKEPWQLTKAEYNATYTPTTSKKGPGEIPTKKDLVSPEGGGINKAYEAEAKKYDSAGEFAEQYIITTPELNPEEISNIARDVDYGDQAEVIERLKAKGKGFIDGYHVTSVDDKSDIANDGIKKGDSWYGRDNAVYFFADPDDIKLAIPYLAMKIEGNESGNMLVAHFRIPVDDIESMEWDDFFNVGFETYSAFVIKKDISAKQIRNLRLFALPIYPLNHPASC